MERRSTLLNQCFTQSCAHARLLCVKPQEAELAHNQQHAPLLRTPLNMKAKKKRKLASVHSQNFFNKLFCCIFLSIAEVCTTIFPTIAVVHSNATAFSFRPYTVCALPMTKGNCTLKCIQLCVLIFFSWHIFTKKSSPDLIMTLQRDQTEQPTCMFVVHRLEQFEFSLCYSGIIWSKEECRNQPDLLFPFDWAFAKAKREMFLLAWGGI